MLHVRTILVPTDLSPSAEVAYSYAVALARRFQARILLLRVVSPHHARASETDFRPLDAGDVLGDLKLSDVSEPRPTIEQAVVEGSSVPDAIVRYAQNHDVDVIVMGARGRNWLHTPIMGGVAYAVIRHAHCPVLTVRSRLPDRGVRRILAPIDFSEPCRESLRVAAELARLLDADLDVLHVVDHQPGSAFTMVPHSGPELALALRWEEGIAQLLEEVADSDVRAMPHVRSGAVAPEITNFALERNADLIVLGTHGASGVRRILLGSVAEAVVRRSPCPVLAVKAFGHRLSAPPRWRRRKPAAVRG